MAGSASFNAVAFLVIIIVASFSELCNCATRSHFALYVCMYVPMSVTLGPWGVIRKCRARVAWLHGLCPRACRAQVSRAIRVFNVWRRSLILAAALPRAPPNVIKNNNNFIFGKEIK